MSDLKHIFSMILISSVFGVAHAAVSPPVGAGSVSLAVTVKLFDLAPEDGITPYISFLDGYTQTTSSSELGRSDLLARRESNADGVFSALSDDRSAAGARVKASMDTDASGVHRMTAQINQRVDQFGVDYSSWAEVGTFGKFVLSPQTLVVFSVDARMTGELSGDHTAGLAPFPYDYDKVFAHFSVDVRGLNPDGSAHDYLRDQGGRFGGRLDVAAYEYIYDEFEGASYNYVGNGQKDDRKLGFVSFMNPGALTTSAQFGALATVQYSGNAMFPASVSGVPEPQAWLMGLLGVALSVGATRRR